MGAGKGLRGFREKNTVDRWFSLAPEQRSKVQFLRELEDAQFVVEHISPDNWKKRLLCTADSGQCYGCEQALKEPFSGWKQKPKMYIDVFVDDGYEQYPAIMSQTLTPTAITLPLIDYYQANGSILNRWFEVHKTGKGKKTKHVLVPLEEADAKLQKINLNKYISGLSYDKQQTYFTQY